MPDFLTINSCRKLAGSRIGYGGRKVFDRALESGAIPARQLRTDTRGRQFLVVAKADLEAWLEAPGEPVTPSRPDAEFQL